MPLLEVYDSFLARDTPTSLGNAEITYDSFSYLQLVIQSGSHSKKHPRIELINEKSRKFRLLVTADHFHIDHEIYATEQRRVAVADYLLRNFRASLATLSSSNCYMPIVPPTFDQKILERSYVSVSRVDGSVSIEFRVLEISAEDARQFFLSQLPSLINDWISCSNIKCAKSVAHWQSSEDQDTLRELVSKIGVSFVADGSILPRAGVAARHYC